MKNYKLKLTVLSPIHIGTGEEYEPINYVIDRQKIKKQDGSIVENNYMYIFDEMKFFDSLNNTKKAEFNKLVSDISPDARFKLYSFIVQNKDIAKNISHHKTLVLKNVAEDYYNGIGKVAQKEGGNKNVFNSFIIAKTYLSPNTNKPVILGSSLKGSISTAYQEKLYKEHKDYMKVEELMLKPTDKNLFRNLIVSDSNIIKGVAFIDEAINKKRNKESKDDNSGVKIRLEAIAQGSEFETKISIKENNLQIKDIINSCNAHYIPLFKSQFSYETDEFTRKSLSDSFVKKYENLTLKPNQFLLKVGKYSGARAVTVDGIRKIKIMQGKGRDSKISNEETTFWSISKYPFGWLLCEITE